MGYEPLLRELLVHFISVMMFSFLREFQFPDFKRTSDSISESCGCFSTATMTDSPKSLVLSPLSADYREWPEQLRSWEKTIAKYFLSYDKQLATILPLFYIGLYSNLAPFPPASKPGDEPQDPTKIGRAHV